MYNILYSVQVRERVGFFWAKNLMRIFFLFGCDLLEWQQYYHPVITDRDLRGLDHSKHLFGNTFQVSRKKVRFFVEYLISDKILTTSPTNKGKRNRQHENKQRS